MQNKCPKKFYIPLQTLMYLMFWPGKNVLYCAAVLISWLEIASNLLLNKDTQQVGSCFLITFLLTLWEKTHLLSESNAVSIVLVQQVQSICNSTPEHFVFYNAICAFYFLIAACRRNCRLPTLEVEKQIIVSISQWW